MPVSSFDPSGEVPIVEGTVWGRHGQVRSAIGEERGYTIRVKGFRAPGFAFPEFLIHAFDLPEQSDIDGLLGWDFLQQFNFEVRPREGILLVSACPPQRSITEAGSRLDRSR